MGDVAGPLPIRPWWKDWPAVLFGAGTLALVGYWALRPVPHSYTVLQVCKELEQQRRTRRTKDVATDDTIELTTTGYRFEDSERSPWSPLGAGKYRILVSGDCFSAECQVDVRDGETSLEDPSYSNIRQA